ncbi:MAG: hypothetical protein M1815_004288 [Lichina confinis]|nr:MAG: hypothetical protein M1815_004288 [Lichina confinis]
MAPKHHQLLVELEDKIEGSGVRSQSMTPPSDLHCSQPLLLDLGLGPPSEEPSPKLPTPPEQSKKLKRGWAVCNYCRAQKKTCLLVPRKVVKEVRHLMKGALKLWDHVGDVSDEVYQVMVEHLQVFKTAVCHRKFGDLAKLKVSPFKQWLMRMLPEILQLSHLTASTVRKLADMPPVKWAPVDEAPTTNDGNDTLGLPVADPRLDPVQPTKHLHLVYNPEDYKGDGMLEQE